MFEGSKLNNLFTSQDIDILNSIYKGGNKFNNELSRSLKLQTSLITAMGNSYKSAQKYLQENLKGHLTMLSVKQKELENLQKANAAEIKSKLFFMSRTKNASKILEYEEEIYAMRQKEKSLGSQITSRQNSINKMYKSAEKPTVGSVLGASAKTALISKVPGLSEAANLINTVKGFDLPGILGPVVVFVTGLVHLFSKLFGQVMDGVKAFRDFGFTASQIGGLVGPSVKVLQDLSNVGVFASPEEIGHSIGQISSDIGKSAAGSDVGKLVEQSLTLQKIWSVNEGVANRFTIALYRLSGGNTKYVETVHDLVGSIAKSANISAQTVVQGMAENMEAFYQSTDKSAGSFGRLIVDAKNLGVQVSTITQAQLKFATDYEGTLEAQAKIQAFEPQISLGPAQAYAEYGNTDQLLREVKRQIDTIPNFDNLPVAIKSAVAGGFGLSMEDLINIKKGDLNKVEEGQKPLGEQIGDKLDNLKTSALDVMVGKLDLATVTLAEISRATTYLASFFGEKTYNEKTTGTSNTLLKQNPEEYRKRLIDEAHDARMLSDKTSGLTKWFDKLGFSDRTVDVATANKWMDTQTQANIGGLNSQNLNDKLNGKLLPNNNIPNFKDLQLPNTSTSSKATGGMVGDLSGASHSELPVKDNEIFTVPAAVRNQSLEVILEKIMKSNSNVDSEPPIVTTNTTTNTAKVESLLSELVSLLKSGAIAVNLDGRKVSSGIIAANSKSY